MMLGGDQTPLGPAQPAIQYLGGNGGREMVSGRGEGRGGVGKEASGLNWTVCITIMQLFGSEFVCVCLLGCLCVLVQRCAYV